MKCTHCLVARIQRADTVFVWSGNSLIRVSTNTDTYEQEKILRRQKRLFERSQKNREEQKLQDEDQQS